MAKTMVRLLLFALVSHLVSCCEGISIRFRQSPSTLGSIRPTQMSMKFGLPTSRVTRTVLSTLRGGANKATSSSHGSFLVGNISHALHIISENSVAAWRLACKEIRPLDLAVISFLAFAPHAILKYHYEQILNKTLWKKNPREFDKGKTCLVAKLLCQIGQIAMWVYAVEEFIIFLSALGVPNLKNKTRLFGSLVYTVWFCRKLSHLKDNLLDSAIAKSVRARKLGPRRDLYSRFLDFIIYLIGSLLFMDANKIDVGVALASIVTLGGVSSVVIGLALKSPMEEIIQGTSLLLSDKFRPGDSIKLGDGTIGSVANISWTDTQLRGTDDSFLRIPHSQLAKTRVINLSRTNRSQVLQEVILPLKQIENVDKIIDDIKAEISSSCPKLITDGTLPFRVFWTDYNKDNIVITVDTNFRIARLSDEYWDNRQAVLKAISRAVKMNE